MCLIFLAGVMPKEYLHDMLFDHHDDVHPVYAKNEIVFTSEHNHCSFVGFVFAPFIHTEKIFLTFRTELPQYSVYALPGYHECCLAVFETIALRGPPSA
jgi:hypothetical protein